MFGKQTYSAFSSLVRELKPVYKDSRFQRIIWLGVVNFLSLLILLNWCNVTRSMGLTSYTYLIFFDSLCLCICALSIWVEQKKPNPKYTFGYERFEVLAVFASTTFAFVSSIFIIKKSIGRWIQQTQIHPGRLFPGMIIAFFCHMLITHCMKNKGLNLVVCASDPSWLQNRISSLNQSLSHVLPTTTEKSPPRMNPFSLLGCAAGAALVTSAFLIDLFDYHSADAIAGVFISSLICLTMYPLSAYSGKILLQGTPPHVSDLLDKCLREASTLDGVLEFRNEHFWLLGFDKIIGTIHVRVRRDANEQIVLSHLLNKLSSLVTDLTIQVFKDEWSWSSGSITRQILTDPYLKFPPIPDKNFSVSTVSESVGGGMIAKDPLLLSHHHHHQQQQQQHSLPVLPKSHQDNRQQASSSSPGGSFGAVPLPPSLSRPISSQHSAVDVGQLKVGKHHENFQQTFSLQSATSTSKYSRELSINPLLTSSPYRSS